MTATGDQGITESEFAAQLDYTAKYVAVWCRSAYAFEFLDWDETAGYRLAPDTLARLEAGGRILEVGAGGGYHTVHYGRRFPKSSVVGLEFDEASTALARQTVAEARLGTRVEIQQGDANQLSAENAYDLVTMNLVLHETGGPPEYHNVLSRVHSALIPGGIVIVSELPYPDSPSTYRQDPVYKKLAGLQIHEALVGCGMITQGELPRYLEEAHFTNIRVARQPLYGRFVMISERSG